MLEFVFTIVLVTITLTMIWTRFASATRALSGARPDVPVPEELQPLATDRLKGLINAPVAVIAYSDFLCPFCGRFARETLPEIDRLYIQPGKVVFSFRHSPIEQLHPLSVKAHQAAECAARQGKFWEMHDALFAGGAGFDLPSLLWKAGAVGLDVEQTRRCVEEDGSAGILADRVAAEAMGLTGTPAFLIGFVEQRGVRVAKVLRGARPYPEFAAAIDDLLVQAGTFR